MRTFNPRDWYWLADDDRVFASGRQIKVTPSDGSYQAWVGSGLAPTPWPRDDAGDQTDTALQAVLAPYGVFVTPNAYAAQKRYEKEIGGINVGGADILTDRASQAMITGAYNFVQATGQGVKFKAAGGFVELTAEQMTGIATAVGMHVQACFAAEAEAIAAIVAETATTREQIDAFFDF